MQCRIAYAAGPRTHSLVRTLVTFAVLAVLVLHPFGHAFVFAGDAILSWDPNPEPDLGGYNVHYGTATGAYSVVTNVGNTTTHTVMGLGAGTYYFAVTAYDTAGNESGVSNEVSKSLTDTTPPVISAITSGTITSVGATITWLTDEASSSQVEYGLTTAYGASSALDAALLTSHATTLTGLAPSTTYHFRVTSVDAAGNAAVSVDNTFTTSATPDTTAPVLSGITASGITSSSAVISWSTDEPATTQVEFGLTSAYGSSTPLATTLVSSHSQTLIGLLPDTIYYYRVRSVDGAGNLSVSSSDRVFTTGTAADTTPPADVQNFTAVGDNQRITLSWTNPADADFLGVRIRFRTDHFPSNPSDGELLGDFIGQPNELMRIAHAGLQNGVTYYYSASSYDSSGNLQSTVYAWAIPSDSTSAQETGAAGGCGMIRTVGGTRSGPGQAADLIALLATILVMAYRRAIRRPLYVNMSETLTPRKFSVEGEKGSWDEHLAGYASLSRDVER